MNNNTPETVHILGICGTFMGGIAALAQAQGYEVSGSDKNIYPPMSTQLKSLGIALKDGYKGEHLDAKPDHVIIGNAGIARGNPELEAVLRQRFDYVSGAQWLYRHVLHDRWVLAVAGTHGKTTTSAMLAWILEHAGMAPGFLIGGVPGNFDVSARLGNSPFFVIEADEYDTSFFDRRSKFVHYRPQTLVLNNLEFDHADIFRDLDAIKEQFHQLIRCVPDNGMMVTNADDANINGLLSQGYWSPRMMFNHDDGFSARHCAPDGSAFDVAINNRIVGRVDWAMIGAHNVSNALAAIAAARHVGVKPEYAAEALCAFKGVKRRMEQRGCVNNIHIYDDFAHHPTAIASTLAGLRRHVGNARIHAVIEPASATMRGGYHHKRLAEATHEADQVYCYQSNRLQWDPKQTLPQAHVETTVPDMVRTIATHAQPGDHVLIMSNGSFGGLHDALLAALKEQS